MRTLACIVVLVALAPGSVLAQDASVLGDPTFMPEPLPQPDAELVYAGERPGPSLGEPLALTIVGAVTSGAGVIALLIGGVQSIDGLENGSPEVVAIAGSVITAVGVPLLLAGIYWLMERIDGHRAAADRASNPLLIRF
jgi:hypothetical protein